MASDDRPLTAVLARPVAAPDLARVTTLLELLGRPDRAYPAIRVGGGHGKSSTVGMVACLLGALGLTAGSYTTPHLQDVRERIRVGTQPIPRDRLLDELSQLGPYLAEVDARHRDPLTAAEVLVGLACAHFADAPVDVAVLEVARGDGDPASLARDEVVVTAGAVTAADRVVTAGADFGVERRALAVGGQSLTLRGVTGDVDDVYLPLHGAHQGANAAVALAAVEAFLGFAGGLDPAVLRAGFAAVRAPGRLEVVRRRDAAPVVLDAAADAVGARALADALRDEFAYRHRVLVLGAEPGAHLAALLAELAPVADHLVVAGPPGDRPPAGRVAAAVGASVETAPDVPAALELASGVAAAEDAVVVAGSAAAVGAARDALRLEPA